MSLLDFVPFLNNDNLMNKEDGHAAKIGQWVGNLKFTEEEMAELDAETAKEVRKFAIDTLSEGTNRSLARRHLAIFIIQFYCLLIFMSAMIYKLDHEWSMFILELTTSTEIGWLALGVGGFFWGTHGLRAYMNRSK